MKTNLLKGLKSENPTENLHEWVDVTEFFENSTKDLSLGEIIAEGEKVLN
jgi:hypothetical protein